MCERFQSVNNLAEMSHDEWERLCDGCAKCCLHKLEDEDTGEIFFTQVACRLLDISQCRCTDYQNRRARVPACLNVRQHLDKPHWLPSTCAYRLLSEGKPLPSWHPLVSCDGDSVHHAGASVRAYAIPEDHADCVEDHVIEWLR